MLHSDLAIDKVELATKDPSGSELEQIVVTEKSEPCLSAPEVLVCGELL